MICFSSKNSSTAIWECVCAYKCGLGFFRLSAVPLPCEPVAVGPVVYDHVAHQAAAAATVEVYNHFTYPPVVAPTALPSAHAPESVAVFDLDAAIDEHVVHSAMSMLQAQHLLLQALLPLLRHPWSATLSLPLLLQLVDVMVSRLFSSSSPPQRVYRHEGKWSHDPII